jgi:hypothetical protein
MENHGALVGWTHHAMGDRLLVKIETVQSVQDAKDRRPDVLQVMMTRNQAAILGSYLVSRSGLQQPARPGLLKRLFS